MSEAATSAALLSARYIAIRTAEAQGLTDRLLEAARDKTPGVRRLFVPVLYRFWHRNREEGWKLIEQIADGCVRFPGLVDRDALEMLGEVSMPILNACRQQPDQLARLSAIWHTELTALFGSLLARTVRVLGRSWVLRTGANSLAAVMKNQPPYQPVNYRELDAAFARPDSDRVAWKEALACLEQPELAPGPIERILSRTDQPFDLYIMMVCERALIYYGARTDPAAAMDLLERLFHEGCPWFRQSILYILSHTLSYLPELEESWIDRFNALSEAFFVSDSWKLQTQSGNYKFPGQVTNADVVAARHRPGRPPHVVPLMMQRAIAAGNEEQIAALFDAIDSVAFYHQNGALALAMLERAHEYGGASVERRLIVGLANVRLLDQPLVDAYLEQKRAFAGIDPEHVAAAEPTISEEDFITLIDGFMVHMMLTSDNFRGQICGAFRRATHARSVQEFLVQILEWVRDGLAV